MFQGRRAESEAKNRLFPCPPGELDAVVLSHAHIDHCGRLPRMVREGFSGPIHATPATCDLVKILLADSAKIQQEDSEYWNRKRVRNGFAPIEPLYTQDDVDATVGLLQPHRLRRPFDVVPGLRCTLHEAGHMLGSAGMRLEIDTNGTEPTRVTFSGDLGRPGIAIIKDPEPLPPCDYLVCESTYGGRESPPNNKLDDDLATVINLVAERGGKIVIPSFAVGRTQVIVYQYHKLLTEKRIPPVPLVVDSPLALRATEIFRNHPEVYNKDASAFRALTGEVFECGPCHYTQNVEESKALHGRNGPLIIISASGMCESGRILHHLKNNIQDPKNMVLIVGFQAMHTLGRRLVEKQKQVRIFGQMYNVRAQVKVLNGFSGHASASELRAFVQPLAGAVKRAFLVHGEPDMAEALSGWMRQNGFSDVSIPAPGDICPLS